MAKRGRDGRFAQGKSGNPKGRPKAEICLTTLLRSALAEKDPGGKKTKARVVIDALVAVASSGNVKAIEQVFNRIDGIPQPVKTDVLDIDALVGAVQQRAEDRRRTRGDG